jgi:hypothetical protein
MPSAVLSFSALDTLTLGRFVLSAPQSLKDFLFETLYREDNSEQSGDQASDSNSDGGWETSWNGNSCVLSHGAHISVHELLDRIQENGWEIEQFSTSLTGSGVQCQTYVFRKVD